MANNGQHKSKEYLELLDIPAQKFDQHFIAQIQIYFRAAVVPDIEQEKV